MVTFVCQNCGAAKEVTPYEARSRKYCSPACVAAAKRVPKFDLVTLTCQTCGQDFQCQRAWVKNGRRKYCSKRCLNRAQTMMRAERHAMYGKRHTPRSREQMSASRRNRPDLRGPNHPAWKGGSYLGHGGYRLVLAAQLSPADQELIQPMLNKTGYIQEHRLVVARTLRRPLEKHEIVHHRNGDKTDNRPENLELIAVRPHSRLHQEMIYQIARLTDENIALKSLLLMCLQNGQTTSSQPES
jgi:hypothetical protein